MPELPLVPDRWLAHLLSDIATDHPGVYLAGGRVRDWLLNREGRDVDLCLAGAAIPFARRIANASGGAFYVLDSQTDAARILYPERGIVVDVASLRGSDIIGDLRARDLTVNAMAVRLEDLGVDPTPIIDPCDGQADLGARVLRATSQDAFRHDPVRMLRAVRLEAALRFRIESVTEAWVKRDAGRLTASSPERIRYELLQILSNPDSQASVLRLQELGLLGIALPEVAGLAQVAAAPPRGSPSDLETTLDALSGVERLDTATEWRPVERDTFGPYADRLAQYLNTTVCDQRTRGLLLRWSALVHKARSDQSGQLSGLEVVADVSEGETAARVTESYRFSTNEVALVHSTVVNSSHLLALAAKGAWDRRDLYRYFQRSRCDPIEPLLLAWAREWSIGGGLEPVRESLRRLAVELLTHYFTSPHELVNLPTIVTGADVMEWLGLQPGPQVGAVLAELRELQAMGSFSAREGARELIRRLYPS